MSQRWGLDDLGPLPPQLTPSLRSYSRGWEVGRPGDLPPPDGGSLCLGLQPQAPLLLPLGNLPVSQVRCKDPGNSPKESLIKICILLWSGEGERGVHEKNELGKQWSNSREGVDSEQ